jgi:hypothetical protein
MAVLAHVDWMSGNSMFPDPPEPPQLVQTVAQGPWGGPTYAYRGARIECAPGGHVCGLFMPEHPRLLIPHGKGTERAGARRSVFPAERGSCADQRCLPGLRISGCAGR